MAETGQAADPRREYSQRAEGRREALASGQGRHRMLGNLRALVFVAGAVLLYVILGPHALSPWWLTAPAFAFVAVTLGLDRAERRIAKLTRAVTFYDRGLARLDGSWAGSGETGKRFIDEKHPYAQDLDLFGEASLFELLSQARTGMGEQTLAAWLKAPAAPDVVQGRQQAVEELSTRLELREDLAVLGEDARTGVHPDALIAWGEREALLKPSPFRAVAWVLSAFGAIAAVALVFYFAAWVGELELAPSTMTLLRLYFLFIFVTFGIILTKFKKRTDRILEEVNEPLRDLGLLTEVLAQARKRALQLAANGGAERGAGRGRDAAFAPHRQARPPGDADRFTPQRDLRRTRAVSFVGSALLVRAGGLAARVGTGVAAVAQRRRRDGGFVVVRGLPL